MVHPEVVLEGNGSVGLGDFADLDVFFGFECLVEAIGVAAALHQAPGLFVHDFDLAFYDDVLFVAFEQSIGFEQLVDGVEAARFDRVILGEVGLGVFFCCDIQAGIGINLDEAGDHVGHDEEMRVGVAFRQIFYAFFGQFDGAVFFIYDEEERCVHQVHILGLLLHVEVLRFLEQHFDPFLAEEFDEGAVFRQGAVGAQQGHPCGTFLGTRFAVGEQSPGFG